MLSYSIAVSLSAFLLFQIQPIIARHILPWFGGSISIWTACLLFFQVLLLGGYAYSFWISGWHNIRRQAILHLALLAGTLFLLPVIPKEVWKPNGSDYPLWHIIGLLAVTVGGPYFLLSTTGPLLQAWFRIRYPGTSPYSLYALSNAGSLLGLVTYPFLFEPFLSRNLQGFLWSGSYAAFVLSCGWCAWKFFVSRQNASTPVDSSLNFDDSQQSRNGTNPGRRRVDRNALQKGGETETANRPGPGSIVSWLFMSAVGSVLLLSTTNQMCQNVASVPFLWVLPLTLYLITFIIAFEGRDLYRRMWCLPLLVFSLILTLVTLYLGIDVPMLLQIIIYATALFAGCMTCHGELARLRPHPRYLTLFYLSVAGGGALGGAFVAIVSPLVFSDYWEYHICIGALGVLVFLVVCFDSNSSLWTRKRISIMLLLTVLYSGLVITLVYTSLNARHGTVAGARSFYGVINIYESQDKEKGKYREMRHGSIVHGSQYERAPWRKTPTAYYGSETGVWMAIKKHPDRLLNKPLHIGVIGLGTGTLAALGRQADKIRFYEINPDVIRLSREWFSYCQDSPAKIDIVLGDARIQLERELLSGREQQFDVLVADAFSSDSIPFHLLTVECANIYRSHLKDNGILAVHVSNHYLDLVPVAIGLARHIGWGAVVIDSRASQDETVWESTWVLITKNSDFLHSGSIEKAWDEQKDNLPAPLRWTDEFSSLLHVFKFNKSD
jgi:spermidine synthase